MTGLHRIHRWLADPKKKSTLALFATPLIARKEIAMC
jgi:hypothetical protein